MSDANPAFATIVSDAHQVEDSLYQVNSQQPRGVKCQFCGRAFVRRDALRRHYKACPRKSQNDEIPPTRRGRPRRACDFCRCQKIQCDGKCPCNRCLSSQVICSYQPASSKPKEFIPERVVRQQTSFPVPFLLNYTNPDFESITYAFAASGALVEPLLESDEQTSSNNPFGGYASDQALLLRKDEHILQIRAEDLITALIRHRSRSSHNTTDPSLSRSVAHALFNSRSLIHYTSTYFDYFHPHIRFLHRPTFNIATTSLPLLLAIILVGSAHSPPTDDALSAHSIFGLAEDYIFTSLQDICAVSNAPTENVVQAIQAAGLISAMLYASNHPPAVRRESHQRIPRLVAVLRSQGLMNSRRTTPITQMSWRQFVVEESRIRIATVLFFACGINTVSFNHVPQMTVAEMTGDVPCGDALFEAETEEKFLALRSSAPQQYSQRRSLKEWISWYMHDEWEAPSDWSAVVEPKDVLFHIIALHSVIYNARTSLLFNSSHDALVLAMDRWRDLHEIIYSRPEHPKLVGFVKYSIELWWLGRKLLESPSNDCGSRYLAGTPTDTLSDLREFLQAHASFV